MNNEDPFNYALNLLSRRDLSNWELRQKLTHRNYPADSIDVVITALNTKGYLNDHKLANQIVKKLFDSGKYGTKFIVGKLRQRGFPESVIYSVFPNHDEVNENEQALKLMHKQFAEKDRNNPPKIACFLARRGFSSNSIAYVLERL